VGGLKARGVPHYILCKMFFKATIIMAVFLLSGYLHWVSCWIIPFLPCLSLSLSLTHTHSGSEGKHPWIASGRVVVRRERSVGNQA